jgi:hypothetical protein
MTLYTDNDPKVCAPLAALFLESVLEALAIEGARFSSHLAVTQQLTPSNT